MIEKVTVSERTRIMDPLQNSGQRTVASAVRLKLVTSGVIENVRDFSKINLKNQKKYI